MKIVHEANRKNYSRYEFDKGLVGPLCGYRPTKAPIYIEDDINPVNCKRCKLKRKKLNERRLK